MILPSEPSSTRFTASPGELKSRICPFAPLLKVAMEFRWCKFFLVRRTS